MSNSLQVNTSMDKETITYLDMMCKNDERNRAQQVRWLIRQEWDRRNPEQISVVDRAINEIE